jgi:hypothetical protein
MVSSAVSLWLGVMMGSKLLSHKPVPLPPASAHIRRLAKSDAMLPTDLEIERLCKSLEDDEDYFSPSYCASVVNGMVMSGIKPAAIAQMAGIPVSQVRLVQKAENSFDYSQLSAIEQATGRSAGEFALLTCENPEPDFVALVKSLAAFKMPAKTTNSPRQPARKPSLARRA